MLTLVLGRAGAGKTELCLREARAALAAEGPDGPPLVLLCPEQATYQLERALLDGAAEGAALARLQVLSFRRLAHRVLEACGGLARPRLGVAGRRMLLGRVLRARAGGLLAFAGSADRPGLAAALARQLAELEAYALDPDALGEAARRAPPAVSARLGDLALLWADEREQMERRGLALPGSDLAAAAALLPATGLGAGARVWVDGFSGFTTREEHVLEALMGLGCALTVTLCLDPAEDPGTDAEDPAHPFAPTRRTLRRLLRRHRDARRVRLPAEGGLPRFAPGGELASLEAGMGRPETVPAEVPAPAGRVRFLTAADPAAEAEAAAAAIDLLVRQEGFRYRDIAVVVRDMATYQGPVEAACRARGIPLFVDRKRPADVHPAARTLRAALDVAASGWSLGAVRRYLHTDLCPIARPVADREENRALARGLSGRAWHAPDPAGDRGPVPRAGRPAGPAAGVPRVVPTGRSARLRAVLPVRRLEEALRVRSPADACWAFLEEVRASRRIARWAERARAAGRKEEADWHAGCWRALMGLLDQMHLALGPEPVGAAQALEALDAGLRDLTIGLVPPRLDQVLCGAVERSRHPALRAAFVLGLADGAFPAPHREEPLLGDAERSFLAGVGWDLGPTSAQRALGERYLAYIAMTRASERLYLSHPAGPGPSEAYRRAQAAVGHGLPWPAPAVPSARQGPAALAAAAALHPEWAAARRWLASRHPAVAAATAGRGGRARRTIPPAVAAKLCPPAQSPSALEASAACAFQYFGRHALRLRPRLEAAVDPSHVGELVHAALAHFVRGVLEDRADLAAMGPAEAEARRWAAVEAARHHVLGHVPPGAARGPYLVRAAGRDVRRATDALVAHARAGAYRPAAVEAPFERHAVRGRIDRVDVAEGPDGRRHVRVVDYKTGFAPFSLARFQHGLDLALALYLDAAVAASGAEAGGLFVLGVRDRLLAVEGPGGAGGDEPPAMRGLAPADPDLARLHEEALDGRVTGVRWKKPARGEPPAPYAGAPVAGEGGFPLLFRALRRRVERQRARIASGDVTPDPYRLGTDLACARCELLAVCGFDRSAGHRPRALTAEPRPWAALCVEDERARPGETDA